MNMDSEKKPRTKVDAKKAAKAFFREGKSLKQSFMEAGLSETQSSKGKALLTERAHLMKAFKAEHTRQIKRLQLVGQSMDGEAQTDFVRGTLVDVAVSGKGSERVAAASWLGKDRRVNLFAPDNAIGIYQLQVPSGWEGRYVTTPTIDAEEIPPALTQDFLESLPKQDGMITMSSFEPRKLESGTVEIPKHMPAEPEPIPEPVKTPTTNHLEDDYETLR
jgi:hypothetical protein